MIAKIKTTIYEIVLYPLCQLRYGPYGFKIIKTYKHLCQSQFWSREKLLSYQNDKIRKLIGHVYQNVPYYRELMKSKGIKPDDIRSKEDLHHFPVLTKKIIRDNSKEILSEDIKKRSVIKFSTGGTTGAPLELYRDRDTRIWAEAARLRGWSWSGYKVGSPAISFQCDNWPSLIGKLRIGLINEHSFPDFGDEDKILNCASQVKDTNTFCVTGITSYLCRLASIYKKNNIKGIHFPVIFTTSELLFEHQRRLLESIFNGRVSDQYGCVEIGSLAYECDHNTKHITDEHVMIESIDSNGNNAINKPGHLIITDLDNYAMPFIRYKIGDIGTLTDKKCNCGRRSGILKNMDGREQEYIKTIDGNYAAAAYFPTQFINLQGIEQYQIVQSDIDNITLKIVKNALFSNETLTKMIGIIKEKVGHNVNIQIEECENIPLTPRGKTRLVISHVPIEF